ncbi:CoA ester lyase [Solwaraspora sp. WMMD406]|uniref:HpcH/HpaI aldolase/citrate lyase family protein n=1 Tax=Solwaraspora sp. WMMD406 TaxID=3016095 RepID=UPI0024174383|nr:CoA ester lyase [Solwaraspora sp. WMMD406]MDG4762546.1 CoA ester lyase [Solwaraspora sp. WMMD406]
MRDLEAMLYVPAGDARKLDKVPQLLATTTIIVDLEDAVAAEAKEDARIALGRMLDNIDPADSGDRRGQIWVRINAPGTDAYTADLDTCIRAEVCGLVVPKATADSLRAVASHAQQRESAAGLTAGSVALMGLIETVGGWHSVRTATDLPARVHGLSFGAGDLSLELGLPFPPPGGVQGHTLLVAKAELVLHSRRLGLAPPHDGVYPAFHDLDTLRAEAEIARSMGFVGKHTIHPDQVPVVRSVFDRDPAELDKARRILDAAEQARRLGLGNANVDGELVDVPVVERARQLLQEAGGKKS